VYKNCGFLLSFIKLFRFFFGIYKYWGNLREKDHWGDQDIDKRIILRWIFRKLGWGSWGLDGVGLG
jgi:hypothetical protein